MPTGISNSRIIACPAIFKMKGSGLKPLTKHVFYFDNDDVSSMCIPTGGSQGDALITDANGSILFQFVYASLYRLVGVNKYGSIPIIETGAKTAIIKTLDETSMASTIINITSPLTINQFNFNGV